MALGNHVDWRTPDPRLERWRGGGGCGSSPRLGYPSMTSGMAIDCVAAPSNGRTKMFFKAGWEPQAAVKMEARAGCQDVRIDAECR